MRPRCDRGQTAGCAGSTRRPQRVIPILVRTQGSRDLSRCFTAVRAEPLPHASVGASCQAPPAKGSCWSTRNRPCRVAPATKPGRKAVRATNTTSAAAKPDPYRLRCACEAPRNAAPMAGARSALRELTSSRLSERSERSSRSELATRPWERVPQGSRQSRPPRRSVAGCAGSALPRRPLPEKRRLKSSHALRARPARGRSAASSWIRPVRSLLPRAPSRRLRPAAPIRSAPGAPRGRSGL